MVFFFFILRTLGGTATGMRSSSRCLLGEYEGTVRVARRVFQRLLDQSPTPERCLEAFHLQRTQFELSVSSGEAETAAIDR